MPSAAGDPAGVGASPICTWYIRHVDLFHRLTARDVDDLVHALSVRRFTAGQMIVGPETRPEWVYFTRRGTVRLFQHDARGHEVTVEHLDPGRVRTIEHSVERIDWALRELLPGGHVPEMPAVRSIRRSA